MPIKGLTTAQAAERLETTPRQVLTMIRQGRLPAERFGKAWVIAAKDLAGLSVLPLGRPRPDACTRGHPFTEATTYVYPSGSRGCRICMAARSRRNYRPKKSAKLLDKKP